MFICQEEGVHGKKKREREIRDFKDKGMIPKFL